MAREREILAEGVTDKTVICEDAAHIGMAFKNNAEQIKTLALEPIGGRPEGVNRGHDRQDIIRGKDPHPHPLVAAHRQQVDDGRKARAVLETTLAAIPVIQIIDTAQVNQGIKTQLGGITQLNGRLHQIGRVHL